MNPATHHRTKAIKFRNYACPLADSLDRTFTPTEIGNGEDIALLHELLQVKDVDTIDTARIITRGGWHAVIYYRSGKQDPMTH